MSGDFQQSFFRPCDALMFVRTDSHIGQTGQSPIPIIYRSHSPLMSAATLFDNTIEADDGSETISGSINNNVNASKQKSRPPVVLTPATRSTSSNNQAKATTEGDAEAGMLLLHVKLFYNSSNGALKA